MDIENQTPARLKVEYRKVADLIPYARNARTHSDEQVSRIAGSIQEFGWTNPILVDGTNGTTSGTPTRRDTTSVALAETLAGRCASA